MSAPTLDPDDPRMVSIMRAVDAFAYTARRASEQILPSITDGVLKFDAVPPLDAAALAFLTSFANDGWEIRRIDEPGATT